MNQRAWVAIKEQPCYRREAFVTGLQRHSFQVESGITIDPQDGDILVIWNRYGLSDDAAKVFEARGLLVLVAENGYMGVDWLDSHWYAISRNFHNGAGTWFHGDAQRWDSLDVELKPFRADGVECVVLPQRGIGTPGIAMPRDWQVKAQAISNGRIRPHPGCVRKVTPLEKDLHAARSVYTWGSGAAIKALALGIPAQADMPDWIGQKAASPFGTQLNRSEDDRLAMFRDLAWAQWNVKEIEAGMPFEHLL